MGAKDSKRLCLSYEDAQKRMSESEYKRVCEAFKRLTNGSTLLNRQQFIQNVLGDGVPNKISELLYIACGGTQRGIALKDLICGLVLLTRGTQDEKIKFLWYLYCNDNGQYIILNDFLNILQIEGVQPLNKRLLIANSLFGINQDKINFEQFKLWLELNNNSTILSKWLLNNINNNRHISLSSDIETPNFYQTLAGVTHLEAKEICELEKCFWNLQSQSQSGHLDLNFFKNLICPPMPLKACEGLFLALDVNRDGHIDFKELCCGISAACRGPKMERMKFSYKLFDLDRDLYLNNYELNLMFETLLFIANDNNNIDDDNIKLSIDSINLHLDNNMGLTYEEFLIWSVENLNNNNNIMEPLLELLFQICHICFGLKPLCRHHEYDIVLGWLKREQRRGYKIGQFWYLISSDWWQNWLIYTTTPTTTTTTNIRTTNDDCHHCNIDTKLQIEEGIVCDESLISNSTNNSNSMESMGDLLSRGDSISSCSIASSSGVSSSSGTINSKKIPIPGPIDNSSLIEEQFIKIDTLTGEGGRLKRNKPLVQHRDFELVPDSLWKAFTLWYGSTLPLPRQVINPTGTDQVELELYPLNLKILRHQQQQQQQQSWSSVVGGYGAAALNTTAITNSSSSSNQYQSSTRRYLAHTAAFSRLANIKQVMEFLCLRLNLKIEDVRLWHIKDINTSILLEDDMITLQELGINDADQILLEVRNKDLTWPEELGALINSNNNTTTTTTTTTMINNERRKTICLPPGATGLHNLGNTCFMNAALQAVSNTRPLTLYFQNDGQLLELNCINPLGTKGLVAKRYGELCRELWAGTTRSIAPLKLRYCLTKHAPHLSGGGQHDSQELLAWLLDSLHEDLNRVAKKQYTELKDSGGRPDEIVADEAWIQHLNRDHSIITDLFYGQLKSKVVCKTCKHESVRFDPFNLLSLPLPMESYILCEVLVVRLNGETPIKYGLRLNSDAKYLELKQQLEELCKIEPERLLLAEIAYSQIKQILNDDFKINPTTATELYAYELPITCNDNDEHDGSERIEQNSNKGVEVTDLDVAVCDSPLARSPENNSRQKIPTNTIDGIKLRKASALIYQDLPKKIPKYLIAFHRKCVRQENYFLSQQKSKPSLFGLPLLIGFNSTTTCQGLYESVWSQVTRLLSPLPQSDQTNHATDCDDSLGYEFPFTLKTVLQGGQICAICHWTQFCRGCTLPCSQELILDIYKGAQINIFYIAIDWDPTALHLRYQSNREKLFIEDESINNCRKKHTEPIDLDYCLRAFTSEESLEAKYHCSNCENKQPATKKLQIWRLPPILIIHLKRFDYVNNKWVKTQKVVNFPFKDFDPTEYLASIPQETILRHKQLLNNKDKLQCCEMNENELIDINEEKVEDGSGSSKNIGGGAGHNNNNNNKQIRNRLKSTSLLKTPIIDENLKDYHQHKLLEGEDPFNLKYQLYAVVSHSGMLNGGHYISYACNPNGNWYCYNDSSCREVILDQKLLSQQQQQQNNNTSLPKIDTSSAYILFYERSGLDYKPYLPDVITNRISLGDGSGVDGSGGGGGGGGDDNTSGNVQNNLSNEEFDDSELNKQSCSIQ